MIGPALRLARAAYRRAAKAFRKSPAGNRFIPPEEEWVGRHYLGVPSETVSFTGPLDGTTMLNVGCGEMLTDFGFLRLGVKRIVGLGVHTTHEPLEDVAARLRTRGYRIPGSWPARLMYCCYDGRAFPFPDESFDFVFSWSAFEHIQDVPAVLAEIRRVVRPNGRILIQVYPWFPSFLGSHLTDYIPEPFFHLKRSPAWVREHLEAWVAGHPDKKEFVLNHMWGEFQTLNRYSVARFLEAVRQAGFTVARCHYLVHDEHLSHVPDSVPLADALIAGATLLLKKT